MSKQSYFDQHIEGPSTSRSYNRGPSSYTMERQRKYYNDRKWNNGGNGKSRMSDLDGDVDMITNSTDRERKRHNPCSGDGYFYNRKKYNINEGGKFRHVGHNKELWFKIIIPFGRKTGKDFILKEISSHCEESFIPVNFQFNDNDAEFYVQGNSAADQVKKLHRKITTPDGYTMKVFCNRCAAPVTILDSDCLKVIEQCMSSRYDPASHVLNLTKFHQDGFLKTSGYHTPLNNSKVLHAVLSIIKEKIPVIETLDLTDNLLYTLEPFNIIVPVCMQLKSVVFKTNKLRNVSELNHLKGMNLLNLVLDGNPLCDDFKSKTSFISAVRERFPKLCSLDGHELPPPIGFDLGPETCPVSKKLFLPESHSESVMTFLKQYYTIYDSGDRSGLLGAYHEQATFSLNLSKNTDFKSNGVSLASYSGDNRNLLKVKNPDHRFKLLKQGKLNIVSALSEMPQTMHDPNSFSIDIFLLSPVMSFSVIGVFKEVGAEINNAKLKTFHRTFVVTFLSEGGLAIINETLFIAHASQDQISKAFKFPAPTPSPSPAPSNEERNPSEKHLMVLELCKESKMNVQYSSKCLEEYYWDYEKALAVFRQLQSEEKIPHEAFISQPS